MNDDIYARMRDRVLDALRLAVPGLPDSVADKVEVSPARDPAHGDMATNAALVAAKAARQTRVPDSPDLLAMLTHRKKTPTASGKS